jgi:poly(3-hydroxybutyrate) depolymerase
VVLIVAPLSGHYATLLRDTVRTMLSDHKVYITDWKNARAVPLSEGDFHLDDYVNYVQEFIRHLQKTYGNCHVVSVCQPTVPVLAAVSLMASRGEMTPLSMTMMGGPIDARRRPPQSTTWPANAAEWFENNVIYRVPDNFPVPAAAYPGFLQHAGFVAMNPDRHATSHYDYFKDLIKGDGSAEAHRKFYDEYNAVLDMDATTTWKPSGPCSRTPPGQRHLGCALARGKLERVRPQDITQGALLTVEGELDDISGAARPAPRTTCARLPSKEQRHIEVKGAGHYGIFSGRRWRESVYPQVRDFIREHQARHSSAPVAAIAPAAPASPAKAQPPKPAKPPVKAKPAAPVTTRSARSGTSKANPPRCNQSKAPENAPAAKEVLAAPPHAGLARRHLQPWRKPRP